MCVYERDGWQRVGLCAVCAECGVRNATTALSGVSVARGGWLESRKCRVGGGEMQ